MKKKISLGLSILFLSFIYGQDKKVEINAILDQWHDDAAKSNFEAYFNKMSPDGIFIGTDALENWTVSEFKDFSKPFFEEKNTWQFIPIERNIYFSLKGNIAWFDELLDTWMGICRGSGVLVKNNSDWKIAHYVLSVVIPNKDINEVILVKKENDKIIIDLLNKKKN